MVCHLLSCAKTVSTAGYERKEIIQAEIPPDDAAGRHLEYDEVQPQNPEVSCSFWDTERTPFSSNYERRRDSQGLIGEGSFGRVEHVRSVGGEFKRWCAKHIRADTRRGLSIAQHELQMLKRQSSLPGSVQLGEQQLCEYMDTEGLRWAVIVMSFEEGHSVVDMVKVLKGMNPNAMLESWACDVAIPSLKALSQLHDAGLAHCDWKPDNLVLQQQPDGTTLCKPVDFGFAHVHREQTDMVTSPGEKNHYSGGTQTFMSPELLTNRLQCLKASRLTTAVDRCSADVYANGVMLTLLLKAVLREVPFEYCLFEPRDKDRALLDHQKLEAHLANYRRFMQYPHEHYSPLRFLGSFKVPRDCQDFLRAQLAPQDTRLTAAKALSHSFLKRMAKRRAEAVSAPPTPPPRRPDWWMLGRKQSMKFACFVEPASDADSDYDSVAVIHADCSARSPCTTAVLLSNVTSTWQRSESEETVGSWRAAWNTCTALLGSAAAHAGYVKLKLHGQPALGDAEGT